MIIIDTREPTNKIKDRIVIENYPISDFKFQALPLGCGDYMLEKEDGQVWLIERKTPQDLLGSIFDKSSRMKEKIFKMRAADRSFILLEGHDYVFVDQHHIKCYKDAPPIKYDTVAKWLIGRCNEGTQLFWTNNLAETVKWLWCMYKWPANVGPAVKLQSIDQIMMCFPGVGMGKLSKLKEKYASPLDAFVDYQNWLKILDLRAW